MKMNQDDQPSISRKKAPLPKKRMSNTKRWIFLGCFVLCVIGLGIGVGFLTASLNTKEITEDLHPSASSQIYDCHGNEFASLHAVENRQLVTLQQIPKDLQNAFIAVEDARFYEHIGIDFRSILRAIVANISSHGVAEGASTITQQLAKNAYLTQEQTFRRKIQEMFLAFQLERRYTKDEILELYLNQIYFGQGAYGVQAAAKTYFGKDVSDLDLNESAMLAGIPKSPNYYSPLNNLEAAMQRKSVVLDQMQKYGYIDAETCTALKTKDVVLSKKSAATASYFLDYITQILLEKYGADAVYKEGLQVYTTLDVRMQQAAEKAIELLPTYSTDANGLKQPQGALVAIDPNTGQIKAMVGGRGNDQFNRAVLAVRQPGSSFKPFVFAAALENSFTPETIINDGPIKIGDWEPMNYNRDFKGKVTLRRIATLSLNVPTVKIAQRVGINKVISLAQAMGISTFVLEGQYNDANLSTALGGLTRGVTPLEMASAYGTFAKRGIHVEPVAILKVVSRDGTILEQASVKQRTVMEPRSAALLTSMLEDVMTKGTGTGARISRPCAGKTGTTSDYRDAWFVGYTPDLVAAVWMGCDTSQELPGITGSSYPSTIWRTFMEKAVEGMPVSYFENISKYQKSPKPWIKVLKDDPRTSIKLKNDKSKSDKSKQNDDDMDEMTEDEMADDSKPAQKQTKLSQPSKQSQQTKQSQTKQTQQTKKNSPPSPDADRGKTM